MKHRQQAQLVRLGILDLQVCVPKTWDDIAIIEFAENQQPCGTENGWSIRKQGDPLLNGANERVPCEEKADYVHVMLDA